MDGWLTYHAVFVACVAAVLYKCGADPRRLADDPPTLRLMCRSITCGFGELHAQGIGGRPASLALFHSRLLLPIAVQYWARTMRSPMGELCFAAHSRHAQAEMQALGAEVIGRVGQSRRRAPLTQLLR
jgi:2-dehydropantoate 2-reductase